VGGGKPMGKSEADRDERLPKGIDAKEKKSNWGGGVSKRKTTDTHRGVEAR